MPFLYGAFAIITAIGLGILAAWLRKILSDLRKKKPKEEVKTQAFGGFAERRSK